ncbi:hypothetical protein [Peribacillus simplex]|uniref:hypothetical protein n=1 Tax=Peribacillus simplex TaxID=1478 RepID=UPI003D2A6001
MPVGSPLDTLFPQESRTFRSNQLAFFSEKTIGYLARRDHTDACFDAAWQTVGGKGADS